MKISYRIATTRWKHVEVSDVHDLENTQLGQDLQDCVEEIYLRWKGRFCRIYPSGDALTVCQLSLQYMESTHCFSGSLYDVDKKQSEWSLDRQLFSIVILSIVSMLTVFTIIII